MNPYRFTTFSTDGVGDVKNFTYMCSGFLCCVCDLINDVTDLFMVLICGLVQVLFLSIAVFNSYLQTRCCGSISCCVGTCCGAVTRCASYDAHLVTAPQHIPTQHDMLP